MSRLVILAGIVAVLFAQQPPVFDVAVIKPADPANTRRGMGFGPGGRTLSVDGMTALGIIREAYGLFPEQLRLDPAIPKGSWIDSQQFDITAKSEGDKPVSREQSNLMLRQLLADRFGLKIHHETREITVYSLVVGKTGPKLGKGGSAGPYLSNPARGKLVGTRASMASLVKSLGGQLNRPVFDDTGLAGAWDFTLTWAPDDSDPARPSLFTALQDQLGLRLESKKRAVDVIVIDRVEKPSQN